MEWAVGNDILGRVSRHGELKTEEAFFSGPSKHVACLNMTTPTYNICLWRLHRRTQLWAAYFWRQLCCQDQLAAALAVRAHYGVR